MAKSLHPKVSYILTTFNRPTHLANALSNARRFISDNDELIVIDGGDASLSSTIISYYSDIITFYVSESDRGEAHAANKGLLLAGGQYVKFLTDDDITIPDSMEMALAFLDNDPSIDALLCSGEGYTIAPDGTLALSDCARLTGNDANNLRMPVSVTGGFSGVGLGLIIRRRILPLVGLFDTSYHCVDSEYIARLKNSNINFQYYDIVLYHHIAHPHSLITDDPRGRLDAVRIYFKSRYPNAVFATYTADELISGLGLNNMRYGNLIGKSLWISGNLSYSFFGRVILLLIHIFLSIFYALFARIRLSNNYLRAVASRIVLRFNL